MNFMWANKIENIAFLRQNRNTLFVELLEIRLSWYCKLYVFPLCHTLLAELIMVEPTCRHIKEYWYKNWLRSSIHYLDLRSVLWKRSEIVFAVLLVSDRLLINYSFSVKKWRLCLRWYLFWLEVLIADPYQNYPKKHRKLMLNR